MVDVPAVGHVRFREFITTLSSATKDPMPMKSVEMTTNSSKLAVVGVKMGGTQ